MQDYNLKGGIRHRYIKKFNYKMTFKYEGKTTIDTRWLSERGLVK